VLDKMTLRLMFAAAVEAAAVAAIELGAIMSKADVRSRQAPLRRQYAEEPEAAMVADNARTEAVDHSDPFHASVFPRQELGVAVPIGVHEAVGGLHDAPTPGDMLCAALAACQDSSIRMVANIMGVQIESLEVDVRGDVDVRGTLAMDPSVPVGFVNMRCTVHLKVAEDTDKKKLEKLAAASERCCVIQQTLAKPPVVETVWET